MSAHDDYLDAKEAYERWAKAYAKWGNAADDEKRLDGVPERVKAEKKAARAADRYLVACDYLASMARKARDAMLARGWKPTASKVVDGAHTRAVAKKVARRKPK